MCPTRSRTSPPIRFAVEKYANIICVAKGSEDKKAVRALVEVLTSEDFKSYFEEHYGEDVLPAF